MVNLSSQSLQELRQQLDAAVAQASAMPAATAVPAGAPADFCSAYKIAKPILQTAITLLPTFLPGTGTTIASALTALITVADKACPPS
jgi:hypothetical protein